MNGIVAEYAWPTHDGGAVRVRLPDYDFLVVEAEWIDAAGDAQHPLAVSGPSASFVTPDLVGEWVTVFDPDPDRQEAYVYNNHSDPSALVLVAGGPYPPKVLWPDGPPFLASTWKGSIRAMSPTHANVRCSSSQVSIAGGV